MKNKGLLLIAGGIAVAAVIIAWLMFGGEAPKDPDNIASNVVNAVVKIQPSAANRTAESCGSFLSMSWKVSPVRAKLL